MRKIEQQMIEAIKQQARIGSRTNTRRAILLWRSSVRAEDINYADIYLHGNHIASYPPRY
jgi:hypothetical protein